MKSISRIILSLTIIFMATTGCNPDDFTGQSTMIPTTPFPGITVSALPMNVVMEEVDTTMEFSVTLASVQTVDVSIKISVDPSSTATEGEDFTLSTHNVVIPAFTTSGSFSVTIVRDGIPEADEETMIINVGDVTTANAVFAPQQMSITLTNYFLATLNIVMDWDKEFEFIGTSFTTCPFTDLDNVCLADDAGTYSYSNDWGACPEEFTNVGDGMPTTSLIGGSNIVWNPDSYLFIVDLFFNGLQNSGLGDLDFPVVVHIERLGVTLPFSWPQRADQAFNGDSFDYYAEPPNSPSPPGLVILMTMEAGNVYKFYDPVDDDLLLTTRMSNLLGEARAAKAAEYEAHHLTD